MGIRDPGLGLGIRRAGIRPRGGIRDRALRLGGLGAVGAQGSGPQRPCTGIQLQT